MPFQILLNLIIAFLWMFLQDEWRITTFTTGYLLGLGLIFLLRRFFAEGYYLRRIWAIFSLLWLFIKELVASSILVIRQVLKPKMDITPGIFVFETELESDWELTMLAMLITLTPGSVVMEITPDGKKMYTHAMDVPESRDMVLEAKERFEKAIMEVTRDHV